MDFCILLNIWAVNLTRNISKNLSRKYNQKRIDHAKQSATDGFKTASKKSYSKNSRSN